MFGSLLDEIFARQLDLDGGSFTRVKLTILSDPPCLKADYLGWPAVATAAMRRFAG